MALERITCPACGSSAPATARFCPECGRSLVMAFSGPRDESTQDITPTTAPTPELTPEPTGLEQEIERAEVEDYSGGDIPPAPIPGPNVPTDIPDGQIPEDVVEDMTQPASYAPPEYSTPETPRYATVPTADAQYVPYSQYATPPAQPQYQQFGAPAETRDISRVEAPQTPVQPPYPQPAYPAQYGYTRPKDPTIGLLLELIGLFGVLGIGHIYAGKVTRGVLLMGSFFLYFIVFGCLSFVLIGIPFLLLYWIVPIISALYLRNEMERELRQGYQNRY